MPYRKIFLWGLIIVSAIAITFGSIYLYLKHGEEELILERKELCEETAMQIARQVEGNENLKTLLAPLVLGDTIFLSSSRAMEEVLTAVVNRNVKETEGLEGGFYFQTPDNFVGYAYPTSEPPIPAYGPPPRSYNIIRDQARESVQKNRVISELHRFDPAVFPLTTYPFSVNGQLAGSVWVRIHIERDLPVAKLRQVLYVVTVIFGMGFLGMAILTLFLRNSIRSIQKELASTRSNPDHRLKLRGGLFEFIPRRINEMLDLIENSYKKRSDLEKKLHHKAKLASLGKMIAGVAHEVRTPLSVIKTRLQMWQMNADQNREAKIDPESITMVVNEINRLSDLMKRLVVFSRPIYDHLKPTSVNEVLEEVLSMMDMNKFGDHVRIGKKFCENPPSIISDPNSLKQVFINVINNAGESIADEGEVFIETTFSQDSFLVKISDTGQGMDEDIMEGVFEPFYSTKETGTGLGLTISKEIIMSFGGEISFRKNEPCGTICFVTLPLINNSH